MPRPQTEAAAFLNIYKLVVEKKRLQAGLASMDERRQQIGDRLMVLESQIAYMETVVQHLRPIPTPTSPQPLPGATPSGDSCHTFDMLFEDY